MITRDTILDLAQQARSEKNWKLGDLLLTVAGMLEIDGTATGIPELFARWGEVYSCHGAFGLGLAFLVNREQLESPRRHLDVKLDLKTAAHRLAIRLRDHPRVICVAVRAESIAVMVDHTKVGVVSVPDFNEWDGWPVEFVDHGPMAVMGGPV